MDYPETSDDQLSTVKDWRYHLPRLDSVEPPVEIPTNWYYAEEVQEEHAVRHVIATARLFQPISSRMTTILTSQRVQNILRFGGATRSILR